jgi:hypothetical protein
VILELDWGVKLALRAWMKFLVLGAGITGMECVSKAGIMAVDSSARINTSDPYLQGVKYLCLGNSPPAFVALSETFGNRHEYGVHPYELNESPNARARERG